MKKASNRQWPINGVSACRRTSRSPDDSRKNERKKWKCFYIRLQGHRPCCDVVSVSAAEFSAWMMRPAHHHAHVLRDAGQCGSTRCGLTSVPLHISSNGANFILLVKMKCNPWPIGRRCFVFIGSSSFLRPVRRKNWGRNRDYLSLCGIVSI